MTSKPSEPDSSDGDENDDEADFGASADARPSAPPGSSRPWIAALATTAFIAAAFAIGFQPARQLTSTPFVALGSAYSVTSIAAVHRLRQRDELSLLRLKSGDVSIAALVGGLLYGLAYATHALVTSRGPRAAWVFSVYVLLGDPFADRHHLVAAGLAVVGVLEELTWRGMVLPLLEGRSGTLRASVTSSILYATSHMPSMFLLASPLAGPNPLLVLASLGCGLVWAYLRYRTGRLAPVLLAHGLFTWAVVEFPLWRP
jgi:membrane protease YdiL (CAAX protease family)